MPNLDGEKVKGAVRGLLAGDQDATSKARSDQLAVKRFVTHHPFALTANTSTTQTIIPVLDRAIRVTRLRIFTSAAQASSSDGWTFAVKYDDGAGGASTSTASFTTTGNALAANNSYSSAATVVDVAAGKRLFLACTAVNAVAAANAMTITCSIEYDEA